MAEVNGIHVPFIPLVDNNNHSTSSKFNDFDSSFKDIFEGELKKLKFSNHATKRLEDRNIQLSETELSRIQQAVDKAEMKGSKDSLVMMDDKAFIVNVPNKTVITAMQVGGGDDVFTNIDSVVFTT